MSRNGHRQYDPIDGPQYGGMSIRPPSTRQTQTHVQSPSGQGYHYQGGRGGIDIIWFILPTLIIFTLVVLMSGL